MPFCGKCGTELGEGMSFCGKCGNPIAAESGETPPPGPPPPPTEDNSTPPPPPAPPAAANTLSPNIAALLAYVLGFITGIIFLVLEPYKNDKFVRFHAFQSIFYHIAIIAFWIIWNLIFWTIFGRIGFLWPIMSMISSLVFLGAFLLWIFLMYKAYNNERFMIPIIGEIAARQAE